MEGGIIGIRVVSRYAPIDPELKTPRSKVSSRVFKQRVMFER